MLVPVTVTPGISLCDFALTDACKTCYKYAVTSIIDEIEKKKRCPKSKYFFNLSIEEYEMLLYVIEVGEDCFSLLKDYYSQKALSPFSGFLMARYPQVKMTNFMKEIYDKATATMGNTLFGNYKTAAPEGTAADSQI